MPENIWSSWQMTTVSILLAGTTVLVTTLVMGYRGTQWELTPSQPPMHSNAPARVVSVPSQMDVEACNAYARQRTGKSIADGSEYQAAYRSCMRQKGH